MKSWKEITLGDDYIVTNAKTLNKDYPFSEIFYLDTGSITKGKVDNYQKIALKDAPSRAKRLLSNNDIIYSSVRPANRHYGFFSNPIHNLVVSTGFIVITCNEKKLCPLFLYYYLAQEQIVEELHSIAEGSTSAYPSLLPTDIESMVISIPPTIHEQRAIAAVLSSLDDKIDLIHRQNATLEAMAEALFVELFIKNDEKDNIDYISKYINFNPSYSIQNGTLSQFLEMSNVNTDSFHPLNVYYKKFTSGTKFINKDTLLARITPCLENGKACYVTFLGEGEVGWGSTEYIVMRPTNNLHPFFAYCLSKSDDFRGYAENCLQGSSGRQRIDMHHLQQYQINSPVKEKIDKFNELALAIEPKLHNNFIQICTLEQLRDTLLPKLMSGEVRVDY